MGVALLHMAKREVAGRDEEREVTRSTMTGHCEFCQYKLNFYLRATMMMELSLINHSLPVKPSAWGFSVTPHTLIKMEWWVSPLNRKCWLQRFSNWCHKLSSKKEVLQFQTPPFGYLGWHAPNHPQPSWEDAPVSPCKLEDLYLIPSAWHSGLHSQADLRSSLASLPSLITKLQINDRHCLKKQSREQLKNGMHMCIHTHTYIHWKGLGIWLEILLIIKIRFWSWGDHSEVQVWEPEFGSPEHT